MKKLIALVAIIGLMSFAQTILAQVIPQKDSIETLVTDSVLTDSSAVAMDDMVLSEDLDAEAGGVHHRLKKLFVDGTPLFMSLVALALVLGLAFCIERITYLTLSEINAKKLMKDIGMLSKEPCTMSMKKSVKNLVRIMNSGGLFLPKHKNMSVRAPVCRKSARHCGIPTSKILSTNTCGEGADVTAFYQIS